MAAKLLDGVRIAQELEEEIARRVRELEATRGILPGLAVVRVGHDEASRIYVRRKRAACRRVGIYTEEHWFPEDVTAETLLRTIRDLNGNDRIHGILVQLPLPDHLDETDVFHAIDPAKDVDGFHPINVGRLWLGEPGLVPCTPAGILHLIRTTGTPIPGRRAVVVGRSNTVGKPTAALLLREHATVTVCHSRTENLPELCRTADVLVVAVGRPHLVRGEWVKPGAVVIDVGINRVDGQLVGDVDFEGAREVAGYLTPVPGGVGPMTVAMLLANTVTAAEVAARGRERL